MTAVATTALMKSFNGQAAVDGLTLEIATGEIFGFIGPDGAGKTTLFRILTTLLEPDSGEARVLGRDVLRDLWDVRSRVGYMPDRFSLYPDLTVAENLRFFASVFGTTVEREYELVAPIYRQIEPFRDRRAGALSGGMKQKLALSCALVHRPEILFLDEPTTGVDAVSRREFWDLLEALKAGGLTIVVSTPYMDEADRCDRVALIQAGRILEISEPAAIGSDHPLPVFSVSGPDRYGMLRALRGHPQAESAFPFGAVVHYTDRRSHTDPAAIAVDVRWFLESRGFSGVEVVPIVPGIEDVFMARMGAPAGVGE